MNYTLLMTLSNRFELTKHKLYVACGGVIFNVVPAPYADMRGNRAVQCQLQFNNKPEVE